MNFGVLFPIKINTLTEVCVKFKETKFRSVMRGCNSPWKPTNEGDQLGKRLVIGYRQAPLFIEKLIDVPYMVSETNPLLILINVFIFTTTL